MMLLQIPNHKKILTGLTLFACILLGVSTAVGLIMLHYEKMTLLNVLYVNSDSNLPKWYSSLLLALSGVLLYLLSQKNKAPGRHFFAWGLLSFTFFFLSLAKTTSFDQSFFGTIRMGLRAVGIQINPFLFGVLLIALFLLLFAPFYSMMEGKVKKYVALSVIIYVFVSLFFDVLSSLLYHTPVLYVVFSGCEELCEMIGTIIFLYALLVQLDREGETSPGGEQKTQNQT